MRRKIRLGVGSERSDWLHDPQIICGLGTHSRFSWPVSRSGASNQISAMRKLRNYESTPLQPECPWRCFQ